jgi:hypothetical protein
LFAETNNAADRRIAHFQQRLAQAQMIDQRVVAGPDGLRTAL